LLFTDASRISLRALAVAWGLLDVTRRGLPHQATTPAWP
jgi:hypothetical protein